MLKISSTLYFRFFIPLIALIGYAEAMKSSFQTMLIKSLSFFYKLAVNSLLFLLLSNTIFFKHIKFVFFRIRVSMSLLLKFSVKFLIEQVNGTLFNRSFMDLDTW